MYIYIWRFPLSLTSISLVYAPFSFPKTLVISSLCQVQCQKPFVFLASFSCTGYSPIVSVLSGYPWIVCLEVVETNGKQLLCEMFMTACRRNYALDVKQWQLHLWLRFCFGISLTISWTRRKTSTLIKGRQIAWWKLGHCISREHKCFNFYVITILEHPPQYQNGIHDAILHSLHIIWAISFPFRWELSENEI